MTLKEYLVSVIENKDKRNLANCGTLTIERLVRRNMKGFHCTPSSYLRLMDALSHVKSATVDCPRCRDTHDVYYIDKTAICVKTGKKIEIISKTEKLSGMKQLKEVYSVRV